MIPIGSQNQIFIICDKFRVFNCILDFFSQYKNFALVKLPDGGTPRHVKPILTFLTISPILDIKMSLNRTHQELKLNILPSSTTSRQFNFMTNLYQFFMFFATSRKKGPKLKETIYKFLSVSNFGVRSVVHRGLQHVYSLHQFMQRLKKYRILSKINLTWLDYLLDSLFRRPKTMPFI